MSEIKISDNGFLLEEALRKLDVPFECHKYSYKTVRYGYMTNYIIRVEPPYAFRLMKRFSTSGFGVEEGSEEYLLVKTGKAILAIELGGSDYSRRIEKIEFLD